MRHECSTTQNARPLNSQRGETQQNLPQHLGQAQNLDQHQTLSNKHSSQFSIP